MAICHFHAKTLSKAKQSAIASFEYIARLGKYAEREKLIHIESGNMPSWAEKDPRLFWESADRYERKNGRLCKTFEFALPKELSRQAQLALAKKIVRDLSRPRKGERWKGERLSYTYVIHEDGANESGNIHVHVMISERICDGIDRTPQTYFRRAATGKTALEHGGARKSLSLMSEEWLCWARERYATRTNLALKRYGFEERIDARSYRERGIDKIPSIHEGWGPDQEERRQQNEEIRAMNAAHREAKELDREIERLAAEIEREQGRILERTFSPDRKNKKRTLDFGR